MTTNTQTSYERIARDSTIEASHENEDEENKVGDTDFDETQDLRYDIDAIIDNSICPRFDRSKLYNWHTARFYSVIDIIGHPMYMKAKDVLVKHLSKLQQIEARQIAENGPEPDIASDSENEAENDDEVEGEESESSDSDDLELQAQNLKQLPSPNKTGPFRYGNHLPSKDDILNSYTESVKLRQKYFDDIAAKLTTDEEKQKLEVEKATLMKNLAHQRDVMLAKLGYSDSNNDDLQRRASLSDTADQNAFMISDDDEEGEAEEEEEESEEEKQETGVSSEVTGDITELKGSEAENIPVGQSLEVEGDIENGESEGEDDEEAEGDQPDGEDDGQEEPDEQAKEALIDLYTENDPNPESQEPQSDPTP